jgi:hypothetical protein
MTVNLWHFGVRIGQIWSIEQIIGFKIVSSSYITMEMDTKNMELLKAFKEMLPEMKSMWVDVKANQAKAGANWEERKTERKAEMKAHQ